VTPAGVECCGPTRHVERDQDRRHAVRDLLVKHKIEFDSFRKAIEPDMRFPSITIIERIGASQCGIGMLPARIAEVVLRVERAVFRAGSHNPSFGTTVFLPSVVDRHGVVDVLAPDTSYEEKQGSERSAARLKKMVRKYLGAKERSQPISASSCFPIRTILSCERAFLSMSQRPLFNACARTTSLRRPQTKVWALHTGTTIQSNLRPIEMQIAMALVWRCPRHATTSELGGTSKLTRTLKANSC
jgi:hypothetical protein